MDWLLEALHGKRDAMLLLAAHADLNVWVFWVSATGHGGPTLEPEQMQAFGEMGLQLMFDIYFFSDDEDEASS